MLCVAPPPALRNYWLPGCSTSCYAAILLAGPGRRNLNPSEKAEKGREGGDTLSESPRWTGGRLQGASWLRGPSGSRRAIWTRGAACAFSYSPDSASPFPAGCCEALGPCIAICPWALPCPSSLYPSLPHPCFAPACAPPFLNFRGFRV